jgi:hypothetical protein
VVRYCKHGSESPYAVKGGDRVTSEKLPSCQEGICFADMITAAATLLSVTGVVPTGDYSNNTPVSNWCGANR